MTEAEKLTLQMMAAYSTNLRLQLEPRITTTPEVVGPPQTQVRTTPGTVNETRRAQALLRRFNTNPPRLSVTGGSNTFDLPLGTTSGIGGGGEIIFSNIHNTFGDRQFPGGLQNAKAQGIGYRLGQHLGIREYPSQVSSSPVGRARSNLYRRKTAGAITPEQVNNPYSFQTRTLINRGGNFQPFLEGRFGRSIPRMNVLGAASGGLNRLAAADPPVVRPSVPVTTETEVPGLIYSSGSTTRTTTPTFGRGVLGGGAMSAGTAALADPVVQQTIRDNTPQKVARREQLRLQRSRGTDVDNRPSQGSNLDMKAIRSEVKRAEIIVSFDKAFAKARRQGKDEFTWRGKQYNTRLK
jgi:hypothetical protein